MSAPIHDPNATDASRPRLRAQTAGAALVLSVLGFGIVGPMLIPGDPFAQSLSKTLSGPEPGAPFGYDHLGRSLFHRLAHAIYVLRYHLWPEIASVLLTAAAFGAATAIMAIAALGFVSVGMRAPTPELGLMMVELLPYYHEAPFALFGPIVAIFALLLGLTLLAGERPS